MILKYTKGKKSFSLYDQTFNKNQNIFTVIVGKNGTGKSRLLNDVISKFITVREENSISLIRKNERDINNKIDLEVSQIPNKLIAVSTSPYDKFPLPRFFKSRPDNNDFYSYVGIRDLRTTDFSLGFMSKIIGQLFLIRSIDKEQFGKITEVLKYLGYSDEFHVAFDFRIMNILSETLLGSTNPENDFFEAFSRAPIFRPNLQFFRTENDKLDIEKFERFKSILHRISDRRRKRIYNLILDSKRIDSEIQIEDISFLIEAGVAKLRDVGLRKLNTDKIYKISEASSGEQCIFTTLVGISCNISDNSLILIDEPEISLHPEWQEKYIQLLIETFQNYKNCHFIIATHSPQLISKLSTENCFILQMDSTELKNAKHYANNSVDFQLANIFNSPGFKNEYLSRISFSIISKVGKYKKFDDDDILNYNILKSQVKFLKKDDPIINLYKLIEDLKH